MYAAKLCLDPVIPSWPTARMVDKAKYHKIVTTALVCKVSMCFSFGIFLTVDATHHFCLVEYDKIIN